MKSDHPGSGTPVRSRAAGTVIAACAAAALAVPAVPAQAAPEQDGVRFQYGDPKVTAGGDQVVWTWTVSNAGKEAVDDVVVVHSLTPKVKVAKVSAPCKAAEKAVRCGYGALKAGERRTGTLVARLPDEAAGTVQIKGRVTWLQNAAPKEPTEPGQEQTEPAGETGSKGETEKAQPKQAPPDKAEPKQAQPDKAQPKETEVDTEETKVTPDASGGTKQPPAETGTTEGRGESTPQAEDTPKDTAAA